jgi:propionyl-CoA carboxylase beta chain
MAISKDILDDLNARREAVFAGGGKDKADARRAKGLMTARERLDRLFEPGTFQEMGTHAAQATRGFGMEDKELAGDGVVTGIGYVDGRPVASFSQDFTVAGGSLGQIHAGKICDVMDYAGKTGMPVLPA